MDLTTVARVKALAGLEVTDDSHDAILERLIDAYSAEIEAKLDRLVLVGERTEVHRLKRGQRIVSLRASPVSVAPTSVKYHSTKAFSAAPALTENVDWVVDLGGATLELLFPTMLDPGWVQVVYTGGMAVDTDGFISGFPALAEACDAQVVYHWRRRDTPNGSYVVNGGSTNYTGELDLLEAVQRVIDQYRRRYA